MMLIFPLFKDIVANIYLLIVTTADTHAKLFIENLLSNNEEERKVTFNLLNCILECANLPGYYPIDETSSSITFGFWYTLQVSFIIIYYRILLISCYF